MILQGCFDGLFFQGTVKVFLTTYSANAVSARSDASSSSKVCCTDRFAVAGLFSPGAQRSIAENFVLLHRLRRRNQSSGIETLAEILLVQE
jgi:hypothetical protein